MTYFQGWWCFRKKTIICFTRLCISHKYLHFSYVDFISCGSLPWPKFVPG